MNIVRIREYLLFTGLGAIAIHRAVYFFKKRYGLLGNIISYILWRINMLIRNIEINPNVCLPKNIMISHPIGIVIGNCTIGEGTAILQNVTIGIKMRGENDGFPVIGANVLIGAGAVICGKIHIGDGAVIGANAVVLCDVPAGARAVGVPARIIQ